MVLSPRLPVFQSSTAGEWILCHSSSAQMLPRLSTFLSIGRKRSGDPKITWLTELSWHRFATQAPPSKFISVSYGRSFPSSQRASGQHKAKGRKERVRFHYEKAENLTLGHAKSIWVVCHCLFETWANLEPTTKLKIISPPPTPSAGMTADTTTLSSKNKTKQKNSKNDS